MSTTKVFGPPGSGKTTYLLSIVETELENNVHPMKIGYFAFTKKAATEARDRAIQKFPNLNPDTDFPFFRTLHSLAYRCLGITTKDMMSPEHYREFALEAGIELAIENGDEEFAVKADNPILNEINIARIRGMTCTRITTCPRWTLSGFILSMSSGPIDTTRHHAACWTSPTFWSMCCWSLSACLSWTP